MNLLIGNFGDKNLGDEMILLAALSDYPGGVVMTSEASFSQNFTESQFRTVSFPPTGLRSFFKYLTNKKYRTQLDKLKNTDITQLVFAGGGLFAIKWQACLLWYLVLRWMIWFFPKAKIRFEFQGVDQNLGTFSRWCVKKSLNQADFISVRDTASAETLKVLGIKYQVSGNDRVYDYLKSEKCEVGSEKLLILNALKPFDVSVIEAKFSEYKIVFVPFALSDISVLPDDFAHEVIFPQTKTELFDLCGRADLLIGERFHSLVLGCHFCGSDKTFTLKKPYSEKVASFCGEHKIKSF